MDDSFGPCSVCGEPGKHLVVEPINPGAIRCAGHKGAPIECPNCERLRAAILKHLKYTACYDAELASCVREEFGLPPETGATVMSEPVTIRIDVIEMPGGEDRPVIYVHEELLNRRSLAAEADLLVRWIAAINAHTNHLGVRIGNNE